MDPIVLAAGTALVTVMATDAWQQARAGVVALWRRIRPEQAEEVEDELTELRAEVTAARAAGDAQTEQALAGSWQHRLHRLVGDDPALAAELRQALEELLPPAGQPGMIVVNATASGRGRVTIAGRDVVGR